MANEIKIHLHQISPFTSEAGIRGHRVLVDRPVAKGGADAGPMGGELFLSAIGGCFMSTLLAAVRARDNPRDKPIDDIHTEVTGTVDNTPPRFVAVELLVTSAGADSETLERLVEVADRGCIMMNTLRNTLQITVRIGALAGQG
jgi:putative redox protein